VGQYLDTPSAADEPQRSYDVFDLSDGRGCQSGGGGPALEEFLVHRSDRFCSGSLKQDLGNKYTEGISFLPPWKHPAIGSTPGEQIALEEAAELLVRFAWFSSRRM
jgi:hypothetical protein